MFTYSIIATNHDDLVCECGEDHFYDSFSYSVVPAECPCPVRRQWTTATLTVFQDGEELFTRFYRSLEEAEKSTANFRDFVQKMEGR